MKQPRIYIANKWRFTFSIILITIISIFGFNFIFHLDIAEGTTEQQYYEIYIKSGDTLWDLAKQFTPNHKDVRKTIYEICQINQLSSSDIFPGQIIKIPITE